MVANFIRLLTRTAAVTFVALLAWTPTAGAAGGLVATIVPAEKSFHAADAVELDFTLANTGDTDLEVFAWDTPLQGAIENGLFSVMQAGSPVEFIGIYSYRDKPAAADFLVIPAGGSLTARVDLGAAYDLTKGGPYEVAYAPAQLRVRGKGQKDGDLASAVRSDVAAIEVKGLSEEELAERLAQRQDEPDSFASNCTTTHRSLVNASLPVTRSLASSSRTAANSTSSTRYRRWYGVFSSSRHSKVISVHNSIITNSGRNIPFSCSCASVCPGAVACTNRSQIWLCGNAFFSRGNGTSYGQRGPVILHELAHWGNTGDSGYGLSYCQNIATSNPNTAVNNADNYHCFATTP
jgi:peptidyl-Lys metalloendopeptidase